MAESIDQLILARLHEAGKAGLAMGAIVDRLVDEGFEEDRAESAIWGLMQRRLVTPHGYIRRQVRRGGGERGDARGVRRSYEFVLCAWSPEQDAQLDLKLGEGG